MADALYRDNLMEHYYRPRNYGLQEAFDREVLQKNPLCGDSLCMRMTLDGDTIQRISFEQEGCVISRAAASIVSEYLTGKSLAQAGSLNEKRVLELIQVPMMPARIKCAMLALDSIQQII
jgi:nitrogen fixation NifU-like protein